MSAGRRTVILEHTGVANTVAALNLHAGKHQHRLLFGTVAGSSFFNREIIQTELFIIGCLVAISMVVLSAFTGAPEILYFEDSNLLVTVYDDCIIFEIAEYRDLSVNIASATGDYITSFSVDMAYDTTMPPPYEFRLDIKSDWNLNAAIITVISAGVTETGILH